MYGLLFVAFAGWMHFVLVIWTRFQPFLLCWLYTLTRLPLDMRRRPVIVARTEPSWNLGCLSRVSTAAGGSSLPVASGFRCCSIGFPPYKY